MSVRITYAEALDELPPSKRGNARAVLAALKSEGRFSVFAATAHAATARALERLERAGMYRTVREPFPWLRAEITEAGEAWLARGKR